MGQWLLLPAAAAGCSNYDHEEDEPPTPQYIVDDYHRVGSLLPLVVLAPHG